MKPPVRERRPRRSLKDAIHSVLSGEAETRRARSIAPHLYGGDDNPIQMPAITSIPPRLPESLAHRVYRNQDATDGDYYGGDGLEDAMHTARRVIVDEGGQDYQYRRQPANAESIDGFARYLGLPEVNRSLEPSPYRPTRARDERATYARAPRVREALLGVPRLYYAEVKGPEFDHFESGNYVRRRPGLNARSERAAAVRMMLDAVEAGPASIAGDGLFVGDGPQANNSGALLANFTMDRGEDEQGPYISIYDRYDLDQIPLADRFVGRPWEYYDRIRYDPETLEPIEETPAPRRSATHDNSAPRPRKARNP